MSRLALMVALMAALAACSSAPRAGTGRACSVEGTILDADGAPVSGTVISIGDAQTITDTGGHFQLDVTADGPVVARIESGRHTPIERRVECAAPNQIRLPRRPAPPPNT